MKYTTARFRLNGVNSDIDPIDVPADMWSAVRNMLSYPRGMRRASGYEAVFGDPLFPPLFVMFTPQLTEPFWIYAGQDGIATIDANAVHTDVTPASLASPVGRDEWTGGNLNGIAVLNSIQNEPYYWFDGMALALPLPGQRPGTRYRAMRPYKYHLIGMGVIDGAGEYPDALHWSAAADPGTVPATWVPNPTNEAGDAILADETGVIIDGLSLRDNFYVYKTSAVYEMTYAGAPEVMQIRKVFSCPGLLSTGCVASVKGYHVCLGNGDIYRHDGQNIESLVDGVLRDTFFSVIDADNFRNSFVLYSDASEEVWFCVPMTGSESPDLALVWSPVTGRFGWRTIANTDHAGVGLVPFVTGVSEDWDGDAAIWDSDVTRWDSLSFSVGDDAILMADSTAEAFYRANTGVLAAGADYSSSVERLGLDLGAPDREKAIRRIWPRIDASGAAVFRLRLYNQRDPRGGQELVTDINYVHPGAEGIAVNCNARYLGIEISTEDAIAWDCSGFDLDYSLRGNF